MKKTVIITVLMLICIAASAQQEQKAFKGYFVNDEYSVYMRLNLYDNMDIPEHELFGPLPGFLAKQHNGFYWLITDAEVKSNKKAELQMINDYGSEDLSATLHLKNDTTIVLEQGRGSAIKIPKNGKWQKLPSKLTFIRR